MTNKQAAEWQGKSKEKKWQLILEQVSWSMFLSSVEASKKFVTPYCPVWY